MVSPDIGEVELRDQLNAHFKRRWKLPGVNFISKSFHQLFFEKLLRFRFRIEILVALANEFDPTIDSDQFSLRRVHNVNGVEKVVHLATRWKCERDLTPRGRYHGRVPYVFLTFILTFG